MRIKRGASFVLQGPPGTGKSQTITNIIAELLAQGKSVLFVSEKLAALQVVYNRLSAAGINDFCLTLHNPNAKRREIMDQLQNSINLASEKATINQKAIYQLNQLVTERQKLNNYVRELHTIVPPLNENIYRVNGYISSLEAYPDIDYVYKSAVDVSLSIAEMIPIYSVRSSVFCAHPQTSAESVMHTNIIVVSFFIMYVTPFCFFTIAGLH